MIIYQMVNITKSSQPEKSATAQDGDFHLVIHGGARALAQLRWIIRDLRAAMGWTSGDEELEHPNWLPSGELT